MKYRRLGNTGLIVSEVALGTMQFGGKMNMGNLGQEDTTRMVKQALDSGINFIDTADVYSLGESETLLGNALKGIREEIVLATKVRLPMGGNFNRSGATRVNIMREVEASLRRLQTDYIDLYQVHGWDSNTPLEETLRTLDDLVRQGKVRYIGLSNLMSWQAATAVMLQERLGLEKYVTAQMYYSLVGRGLENEFQSFAEYHNIGILVWSPLAGGFLTGKYSRANPAPGGSRFAECRPVRALRQGDGLSRCGCAQGGGRPARRKSGARGDCMAARPAGREQRDHRRPESLSNWTITSAP